LKFDLDEHRVLNFRVVDLCIKEFVDGHHLKHYLEEKFSRKEGMLFLTPMIVNIERFSRASDIKLSASW